MARMKTTQSSAGNSQIPVNILKRNFGDNSPESHDNGEHTEDSDDYSCSYNGSEDENIDCQPSTSLGVRRTDESDDFDLFSLVKKDLKNNIKKRRQQKGLEDIVLGEEDYPRTYQLTASEERKRELRKERNRIAAAKCREKKRRRTDELLDSTEELETRNQNLREQADELISEKEYLTKLLNEHLAVCPNGQGGCRR